MSDLYRKVRAVKRKAETSYYDKKAGQIAKYIQETVIDAEGNRVQRRVGKVLAAIALKQALQEVNNK